MMEITIGQDYRITSDNYNVVLEKRLVNDKEDSPNYGKEYWAPDGYFPNLEQACIGLLNRQIKRSESETIQELQDFITEKAAEIVKAVRS